jgi:uncharacterized protein YlxP (DUF503 family)
MRIGVCTVELYLPDNGSLKGKRRVVKSLKERLKNRFNVSVAEVGNHDLLQRAAIGVAMIGNDAKQLNSRLDKIVNFIEATGVAVLTDHHIEIL